VGAAVAVFNNFDSDQWNSDVYGAMALAARFSGMVKSRAATYQLVYRLWKLDHTLDSFMKHIHEVMQEGKQQINEMPTQAKVSEVSQALRRLYKAADSIYGPAKIAGLTNSSLTSPVVNSIHKHAEDVLELAEWVELFLEPTSLEEIFERGEKEIASGEVFNLNEI
jgi:hypothetical protein